MQQKVFNLAALIVKITGIESGFFIGVLLGPSRQGEQF